MTQQWAFFVIMAFIKCQNSPILRLPQQELFLTWCVSWWLEGKSPTVKIIFGTVSFFQVSVKRWCKTAKPNQWNGTRPKWKNNSSGLSKVNRERERNLSDWRWRWERESKCECEEREREKCVCEWVSASVSAKKSCVYVWKREREGEVFIWERCLLRYIYARQREIWVWERMWESVREEIETMEAFKLPSRISSPIQK